MKKLKTKNTNKLIIKRIKIFRILIIIIISILFVFLFLHQMIRNKYYKNKLDALVGNIVEGSTAPRGYIYDRNHKLLVNNVPIKVIYYNKPKNISTKEEIELAEKLAKIIEIDYSKLTDYELRDYLVKKNIDEAKNRITQAEYKK